MLYGSDHNGEIHTYHIYPLVIIVDRYDGCYSGGKFTVWNSYPEDIPEDIYSDDDTCYYFWNHPEDCSKLFGVGNTIQEAIDNLYSKMSPHQRFVEIAENKWCIEAHLKEDIKDET